ncbi:MAG: DUF3822 family protein [Bacteroidales bacterium]|nr:DUF3822 family protein [Bacteroidales bacterium]
MESLTFHQLNSENALNYTLSIRLMPDGFSFSIHNLLQDNSFCYSKTDVPANSSYLSVLSERVLSEENLLLPFKKVEVIVVSERFTFMPAQFFDESKKSAVYNFTLSSRDEEILSNNISHFNMVNIFGVDSEIYSFLNRTFCSPKYYHHLSILSEYFTLKSKFGNNDKMYVQIREHRLDIVCVRKGKLLLANSYHYNHVNDIAYFILNTWAQINFDAQNDQLNITGERDVLEQTTAILKPYVALIAPVVFPAQIFSVGKEIINAPFDLIALQVLCV